MYAGAPYAGAPYAGTFKPPTITCSPTAVGSAEAVPGPVVTTKITTNPTMWADGGPTFGTTAVTAKIT